MKKDHPFFSFAVTLKVMHLSTVAKFFIQNLVNRFNTTDLSEKTCGQTV